MPTLIELHDGIAKTVPDAFTHVGDEDEMATGDVILSLARFQADGERLLSEGRRVGVRLKTDEQVEALAYDLPRLAVVALEFPKHLDGRSYSNARLLRERFKYRGQIRAVGDILREQAPWMVRVGFDAYEPADDSSSNEWQAALKRYRHVYQRAADDRLPAFAERE
ncbi:MAG: oxidoreductase [Phenylobacterium zucineum]|nr:MAG: oxidoreductase [Phenylobacterium zucineum]